MKEIRAKLARIGREGGKKYEDDPALQELDLDGEWDPDAHDKQMSKLYGDDQEIESETEKPVWGDDIDIGDIVAPNMVQDERKKKKKEKGKSQDDGVDVDAMDADVEQEVDDEEWDGTEEMRKRKLDEYMDEIYGLDFNDMVGGVATRFKYTSMPPQSYGLNPVEILMATDAELNEYVGIKKYAPYREKERRWDVKRQDRLQALREKLKERTGGSDLQESRPPKKRKGKKERLKSKLTEAASSSKSPAEDNEPERKKRRREKS